MNATLPEAQRLRVLLGDPPIDWDAVKTTSDVGKRLTERDSYRANLIRREVLQKNRRGLVVYGDGHLWRRIPRSMIVSLLEGSGASVFAISTPTAANWARLQPDVASWQPPLIAVVAGNRLGGGTFADYYARSGPGNPWRTLTMADQSDAVLFLGSANSIKKARVPEALCKDREYLQTRRRRMALSGSTDEEIAVRLKAYCSKSQP
jgi:hypothetical protein